MSRESMSYESHVARLEEIVAELEGDELELDRALKLFEEGVEHLREASQALVAVEEKVRILVERADGALELRELDE